MTRTILEKCREFSWKHENSYHVNHFFFNLTGVAYILVNSANLVVSLLSLKAPDNLSISIGSISLSSLGLVISGAKQIFNYGENAEKHRSAFLKFDILADNIEHNQDVIDKNETAIARNRDEWIEKEYEKIIEKTPPIGYFVNLYFKKKYKKIDMESQISIVPKVSLTIVNRTEEDAAEIKRQRYEIDRYLHGDYEFNP